MEVETSTLKFSVPDENGKLPTDAFVAIVRDARDELARQKRPVVIMCASEWSWLVAATLLSDLCDDLTWQRQAAAAPKGGPSPTVAASSAAERGASVSPGADRRGELGAEYDPFLRMLKVGVPKAAIKNKMLNAGLDWEPVLGCEDLDAVAQAEASQRAEAEATIDANARAATGSVDVGVVLLGNLPINAFTMTIDSYARMKTAARMKTG